VCGKVYNKPIYRQYSKLKPARFRLEVELAYSRFVEELGKLRQQGVEYVTTDTLSTLIARHTSKLGRGWKRKPRQHYFKFFIRRAEKAGIIKFIGRDVVWKINVEVDR